MRLLPSNPHFRAFRLLVGAFSLAAVLVVGAEAQADDPGALRSEAVRLEQENDALATQESAALLELYALETRLGRAERRAEALRARVDDVEDREEAARAHLGIARHAESVAQQQLGDRVAALYVEGDPDPLEIILGASSLDDVITAVEDLERLADQDEQIVAQARDTRASLRAALRDLEREQGELRVLVKGAERARVSLATARDEKAAYVEGLGSRRRLNTEQVQALEARAVAAEQESTALEASLGASPPEGQPSRSSAAEVASFAADAAPRPGRELTVDAVAYSLPGYTASGLPVGKGVVAVDPTVIPLGTKMYVPGYGPAVAADVGTAIKGLIIDLWFPTYAQAAAWGRKSVTITIYG